MNRHARRLLEKRARKERGAISAAIERLRAAAFAHRGEIQRTLVAGWSFCLDVDFLRAQMETTDPAKLAEMLDAIGVGYLAESLDKCGAGHDGAAHAHLHFSARVYPPTRSSVPDDWENLGRALAALGVPDASIEAAKAAVGDDAVVATRAIHYAWVE